MKKILFIISTLALTLVSCGTTENTSSNPSTSEEQTSSVEQLTTEETKIKILQTLSQIGNGNFSLAYNEGNVDYVDIYTKDYIYYDYWHDAVGLLNPDNKGTSLYKLGVDYNNNVEVLSPCHYENQLVRSIDQHTGLSYFKTNTSLGPDDIVYNDYGYCINDVETVMLLSGLMTQDMSMSWSNTVVFSFNENNELTFNIALFDTANYDNLIQIYDLATVKNIGKSKFKPVEDFIFNFTPYTEVMTEDLLVDFLVDTYTFTSSVENAVKYQTSGSKVMDIECTNTGNAAQLYSYNYNTTEESCVYYANVDGDIYQYFVDGTNTFQEIELGYLWEDFFPSPKQEFYDALPTFFKIKDNVYRSFSTDTYRLLLSVISSDLGEPVYTDAIVENGKVTELVFGFQEYYSGKNSNGDLIHMVVKTTASEAKQISAPSVCLPDEDTPAMKTALDYLKENNYHATITSTITEDYVREIYKTDGYFLDINITEGLYTGLGYYEDANGFCNFFLISQSGDNYVVTDSPNLAGKEYYMSFTCAPEIFTKKDDGKYYVKSGIDGVQVSFLTGNFGAVSKVKSSSVAFELDENNLLTKYTYDFASTTYSGTDEVVLDYENTSLDPKLKSAIDAYIGTNA